MKTQFLISIFAFSTCIASVAQAEGPMEAKFDDEKTGEISSFVCESKYGDLAKHLNALPMIKILPGDDAARGAN